MAEEDGACSSFTSFEALGSKFALNSGAFTGSSASRNSPMGGCAAACVRGIPHGITASLTGVRR